MRHSRTAASLGPPQTALTEKKQIVLTPEEQAHIDNLIASCIKESGTMQREQITTFKNLFPLQKFKAIHA